MFKKLLLLIITSVFAFALQQSFLEPEEAFNQVLKKKKIYWLFKLGLGKDIYLYDDKLKFLIINSENSEKNWY